MLFLKGAGESKWTQHVQITKVRSYNSLDLECDLCITSYPLFPVTFYWRPLGNLFFLNTFFLLILHWPAPFLRFRILFMRPRFLTAKTKHSGIYLLLTISLVTALHPGTRNTRLWSRFKHMQLETLWLSELACDCSRRTPCCAGRRKMNPVQC